MIRGSDGCVHFILFRSFAYSRSSQGVDRDPARQFVAFIILGVFSFLRSLLCPCDSALTKTRFVDDEKRTRDLNWWKIKGMLSLNFEANRLRDMKAAREPPEPVNPPSPECPLVFQTPIHPFTTLVRAGPVPSLAAIQSESNTTTST